MCKCKGIKNKKIPEYFKGQFKNVLMSMQYYVHSNMTTVISKHFGISIFMESFA